MLRSGELRHRITIEARAAGTGTRGESTGSWSTAVERWASIRTLSGDEAERARQRSPEARLEVRIRYWAGLTTRHRIKFGSRILQIGFVEDVDQLHVEMVLLCSEVS